MIDPYWTTFPCGESWYQAWMPGGEADKELEKREPAPPARSVFTTEDWT